MSDIKELADKVEQATKSLHDERERFEDLSGKMEKGLISEAERKELMEKVENQTTKLEDTVEKLGKMETAIQRMGDREEEKNEGKSFDKKAFNDGVRILLKGNGVQMSSIQNLPELEQKTLSNAVATDGGLRVQADMDSEVGRILYDTSNLRSVARVVTTGSNRWQKVCKDTELTAVHTGELDTKALQDNSTTFLKEIPVHEVYSWQGVTEQHLEDADYDVVGETAIDASEAIRRVQNTALITGNNTDRAEGITTATPYTTDATEYQRNKVGTVTAGSATAVTFDELMEVQDALKMGWDANASWLMSRASRSVVRKLKYSSGTNEYIWELSTQAGVPANMLGKPVQIMEDMPSMSTGNVSFVYGDIRSAYVIVDRVGMSILDDPYSGGNVRYLKYRSRYGGGIVNYDAIKYLQQA